jgi:hypothetical protein
MGSQGKKEASNAFVVPIITPFPTVKICTMIRIHQSSGITTFSIWHKKMANSIWLIQRFFFPNL